MNVHKDARLTPRGEEAAQEVLQRGRSARQVARAFRVCERTIRKWMARRMPRNQEARYFITPLSAPTCFWRSPS